MDGPQCEYYVNNQLQSHGTYKDGKLILGKQHVYKNGIPTIFDHNGNQIVNTDIIEQRFAALEDKIKVLSGIIDSKSN